jgi:hypothetical protein
MKRLYGAVFGAACVFALSTTTASAEIVCNDDGDCWHVKERYNYRPEFGIKIYPNDWKWEERDSKKYRWREREGRGYWRKDKWIEFNE